MGYAFPGYVEPVAEYPLEPEDPLKLPSLRLLSSALFDYFHPGAPSDRDPDTGETVEEIRDNARTFLFGDEFFEIRQELLAHTGFLTEDDMQQIDSPGFRAAFMRAAEERTDMNAVSCLISDLGLTQNITGHTEGIRISSVDLL